MGDSFFDADFLLLSLGAAIVFAGALITEEDFKEADFEVATFLGDLATGLVEVDFEVFDFTLVALEEVALVIDAFFTAFAGDLLFDPFEAADFATEGFEVITFFAGDLAGAALTGLFDTCFLTATGFAAFFAAVFTFLATATLLMFLFRFGDKKPPHKSAATSHLTQGHPPGKHSCFQSASGETKSVLNAVLKKASWMATPSWK